MQQHPQLDMAQRMFDAIKVQQTFTIEGQERFVDAMCKELNIYFRGQRF
jgi:hypothetical protein